MHKIRKGDDVIVTTGRDKGKRGTVLRIVDAEHVLVTAASPFPVQVDGDYLGPLPVRFAMTDVPLRLVVPMEFNAPQDDHLS